MLSWELEGPGTIGDTEAGELEKDTGPGPFRSGARDPVFEVTSYQVATLSPERRSGSVCWKELGT